MGELSEQQILGQIAERLSGAFPQLAPDAISRLVHEEHSRFNDRPIRDFVPLFVERHAKEQLAKPDV